MKIYALQTGYLLRAFNFSQMDLKTGEQIQKTHETTNSQLI